MISCGGVLYHLDSRGNVMDRLDTGLAAVQLLSGHGPSAWSDNAVYCALPDGFASMDMPSGVLALDSDGRHISVITRGSGYLTVTKLLDFTGQETGQIGLLDAAMVETAVAGNVTGGLCVDTQGVWSLRLYDLAGTELLRRDLPDGNRCHLKAAGEAFAVLCENTILFYDIRGMKWALVHWSRASRNCGVPMRKVRYCAMDPADAVHCCGLPWKAIWWEQ